MTTTLLDVPGIGADRAGALAENGIRSIEQLAGATVADIAAVPGFGPVTARRSKQNAQALLLSRPERGEKDEKRDEKGEGRSSKGKKRRKKDRKRRDKRKGKGKGKGKKSKKHDKKRKKEKKKRRKGS